jgi:hypothetical protein
LSYYKYTKAEFLDGMLHEDTIRIGTLYEYRKIEQQEIGDPTEGWASGTTEIKGAITVDSETELPGLFATAFDFGKDSKNVTFKNSKVRRKTAVPNAFIYSLTSNPIGEVMKNAGYDSCLEILDIKKFSLLISIHLFLAGEARSIIPFGEECIYKRKEILLQNLRDAGAIYWMKDLSFWRQSEYRIVIPTTVKEIFGKVIKVHGISSCFKEVSI